MSTSPVVAVVGTGSVGKRHLTNLLALGCSGLAVDPRHDRRSEALAAGAIDAFESLDRAIAAGATAVVVASPPSFHVEQAIAALDVGLPVLLEKPVAPTLADAQRLLRASAGGPPILLGYTYRWWPALRAAKEMLASGAIGDVLHVTCTMSAHLADWHPWEPYQEFFMSSRALGGGALLDESHVIDLMLWFFGRPETVWGDVTTLSPLEIDTDDNVDATWRAASGAVIYVHLDLYARPHDRRIVFRGTEGTLEWTFDPNRIRIGRDSTRTWEDRIFKGERNEMFVALAREFIDVVDGAAAPSCTVQDGVEVLAVVEALRESSASGRRVHVREC